jgi:hypothetical protein
MRFVFAVAVLAVVAIAIAECDEVPDSGKSAGSPTSRPTVPAGPGVIRGVVRFNAPRPPVTVIGGPCCPGSTPAVDESTVVNDDGSLKNVVVYIKDGPNVQLASDTSPAAALDQKDCRYVPHVLALRTNQALDVTSHDPTMHNVHVLATANPADNFSETTVGATRQLTFSQPEFIHVKCDVHPWMSAYIAVFDHPYFAVTGDDGKFGIAHLPPGSYTLVAWHEKYGSLEQKNVVVTGEQPVDVQFTYQGP